jgi:uncharacterized protein
MSYPTTVNLKDLPDQGESFEFNRKVGELNKQLNDLIGNHDYEVNLSVRPLGNVFEISGLIRTEMDLICSHCGRDMVTPIEDKFTELIIVMDEKPRAGHSGHTGSLLDEGPACNYVTHHTFDLGNFTHEHIALAEPFQPRCGRSDCDQVFLQAAGLSAPKVPGAPNRDNPFAVLKDLNLKKSN